MKMHDPDTLQFYDKTAETYARRENAKPAKQLDGFLARLAPGADVLELGCGSGHDAEAMVAKGFAVTPTDGSPELARQAGQRLGRTVQVLQFGDLEAQDQYDGVWAKACLLHVPREALGEVVSRVHTALRGGGVFYSSFKQGGGHAKRDKFGRYYNNPSREWLEEVYGTLPWASLSIETSSGRGFDDEPAEFLHVTAIKAKDGAG